MSFSDRMRTQSNAQRSFVSRPCDPLCACLPLARWPPNRTGISETAQAQRDSNAVRCGCGCALLGLWTTEDLLIFLDQSMAKSKERKQTFLGKRRRNGQQAKIKR
jgi:hypothetical protein